MFLLLMRQYELSDCLEDVEYNTGYKVVQALLTANGLGDTDLVIGFGNPSTRNLVWIPYGSIVKIQDQQYRVIQGEKDEFKGNRQKYNQSIYCLKDKKGLHDIYDYLGKNVSLMTLPLDDYKRLHKQKKEFTGWRKKVIDFLLAR